MTTSQVMRGVTEGNVRELLLTSRAPCVSILIPLHPVGRDADQDPLVLKNLRGEARERLLATGLRSREADDFLEPLQVESQVSRFLRNGSEGLAIYLAPGVERIWPLPFPVGPLVTVSERFQVKPLFPMLTEDLEFYLLALSRKSVRVFRGSRFDFHEQMVPDLPEDQKSFLRLDDPQKQLQYRTASPRTGAAGGRRGAMIHGHGVRKDEETSNLQRYVHAIEAAMSRFLADKEAPLVLAGVDEIVRAYQGSTAYRDIMRDFVSGNPDDAPEDLLHREAWSVVERRATADREAKSPHCASLLETGHPEASATIETVLRAADTGHIDTLFVAIDAECWGQWDGTARSVSVRPERGENEADLLNTAAVLTRLHGGTVYAVTREAVPGGGLVAALFRY